MSEASTKIICITDQKVSFPDFSSDYMTLKNEPMISGCVALCAGNDMQYAPLILEAAKRRLKPASQPSEVADAIDEAYQEQQAELIEKKFLKRYRLTGEDFQKSGKKVLTDAVYTRICDRIDKFNLSVRFLVCGFDSNKQGHILTAGGADSVESYDHIGVWAIGEGAHAALSSLAFHITHQHVSPPYSDLNKTLTFALPAKFMAESANSVGPGTFTVVLEAGKPPQYISETGIDLLRKEWLKDGAPKISKKILKLIPDLLFTNAKPENTEEAIQKVDAKIGKPGYVKRLLRKKSPQKGTMPLIGQTSKDQQ
jgi:hypothetical protein